VEVIKYDSVADIHLASGAHVFFNIAEHEQVLVQPYLNDVLEFSVCVIETPNGPVALPPTEVRHFEINYHKHALLSLLPEYSRVGGYTIWRRKIIK
jgi:hypothetical protein